MSGKTVINLRSARKEKQRAEKRKAGDANAVTFGQSKTAKTANKLRNAQDAKRLDDHKRET